MIIIRIHSHRARKKLESILGFLPQGYYSENSPGEFRKISVRDLPKLHGIKGITRTRINRATLHRYISW